MQSSRLEGEKERATAWGMEAESGCWRHLKLPWESCATASYLLLYWPPLSLSMACVSVCLQASQSGSVTLCCFSSWLLRSSLPPTILFSRLVFIPLFPFFFLLPYSCVPFSHWSLWSLPLCWTSHSFLALSSNSSILSCHLLLLPTPLLLTGKRRKRRGGWYGS